MGLVRPWARRVPSLGSDFNLESEESCLRLDSVVRGRAGGTSRQRDRGF